MVEIRIPALLEFDNESKYNLYKTLIYYFDHKCVLTLPWFLEDSSKLIKRFGSELMGDPNSCLNSVRMSDILATLKYLGHDHSTQEFIFGVLNEVNPNRMVLHNFRFRYPTFYGYDDPISRYDEKEICSIHIVTNYYILNN